MKERDKSARVTVSSPRTRAPRTGRSYPVSQEIDEQSQLGQVYIRTLMRSQLRLGLSVVVAIVVALGAVPALFAFVPYVRTVHVLGVGLPWLILGVLVYPVVLLIGWYYVRRAERSEQAFIDLVERS
jgi:hypothetical protein